MRNKESEFVVVFGLNSISGNWNLKVILFVNRPTIDKSKQPIAASISRATIAIVWAVTGWHDTELLTLHQPITRSAHALIGYFLSHCHPPPLMWHPVLSKRGFVTKTWCAALCVQAWDFFVTVVLPEIHSSVTPFFLTLPSAVCFTAILPIF